MGIKKMTSFANGEDILRIDDMSGFVVNCNRGDLSKLITPKYSSRLISPFLLPLSSFSFSQLLTSWFILER